MESISFQKVTNNIFKEQFNLNEINESFQSENCFRIRNLRLCSKVKQQQDEIIIAVVCGSL